MLKLEKIARTRDINVCLRDKPVFLNKTFFVALGYALGFHLSALLLIQISAFKVGYQESIFLPAFVATDFKDAIDIRGLQIDSEDQIPFFFLPPAAALPDMMPFRETSICFQERHQQKLLRREHALLSVENHMEMHFEDSFFADPPPIAPVVIAISGMLADNFLLHKEEHEEELAQLVLQKKIHDLSVPQRFLFHVQVEDLEGEVFWWELVESSGEELCYEYAVAILKSLRFQLPSQSFAQKGDIEISFNLSLLNWNASSMVSL